MSRSADKSEDRLLFLVHFDALKDPRRHQHKVVYPLPLLLLIAVAAALCGMKDWEAAADFAEEKRNWLSSLWPFDGPMPSPDTLERVFGRLDPKAFRDCLVNWLRALKSGGSVDGLRHLALDGKSVEGAHARGSPTVPLHLVHAFLVDELLLVGIEPCEGAPGEPQAALRLLETLELRDTVVTGDANLNTRAVADKIVDAGGDYVFALKGNRGPAHTEVRARFCDAAGEALDEEVANAFASSTYDSGEEEDHGRIERRRAWVFAVTDQLPALRRLLSHAETVIAMVRERSPTDASRPFRPSRETSFYVSSLAVPAERLAKFIRAHWQIENQLHRQLDIVLHEDGTHVAKGDAAENLATVCRVALQLMRADTTVKGSAPKKMRHAIFNDDYRTHLMRDLPS